MLHPKLQRATSGIEGVSLKRYKIKFIFHSYIREINVIREIIIPRWGLLCIRSKTHHFNGNTIAAWYYQPPEPDEDVSPQSFDSFAGLGWVLPLAAVPDGGAAGAGATAGVPGAGAGADDAGGGDIDALEEEL